MSANPQAVTKFVVGYFPGWAIHGRDYHVSDIPEGKLTHVSYAFARVSPGGKCESINPQDDQINFPALQLMKQKQPKLKTLISIGGAGNSSNFSIAAKTSATRNTLAQSCIDFMKTNGFDGIDICWEFPGPSDKSLFTALLEEIRNQLDTQGSADNQQ